MPAITAQAQRNLELFAIADIVANGDAGLKEVLRKTLPYIDNRHTLTTTGSQVSRTLCEVLADWPTGPWARPISSFGVQEHLIDAIRAFDMK